MTKAEVGKKYKHFKGHLIRVIAIGKHSETDEELVVYEKLEAGPSWEKGAVRIRPRNMFEEDVTRDGKTFPRFELLEV